MLRFILFTASLILAMTLLQAVVIGNIEKIFNKLRISWSHPFFIISTLLIFGAVLLFILRLFLPITFAEIITAILINFIMLLNLV